MSMGTDTLTNLRQRFEALAVTHGRELLAEHVAAALGWDTDEDGSHRPSRVARRGVFVMLGLEEDRHGQVAETIQSRRAARVHEVLDWVEGGGLPRPAAGRVARHGLGAGS